MSETTASEATVASPSGEGTRESAVVSALKGENDSSERNAVAAADSDAIDADAADADAGDSDSVEASGVDLEAVELDAVDSDAVDSDAVDSDALDSDAVLEVDVEEFPLEIPRPAPTGFAPPPSGFQAFLQHANLHNLLQIESLSRTTGVFLVLSQGRRGYLHLANGDLIHAEVGALSGENAAAEILSWDDGEFKSCSWPLTSVPTIHSSLQALLLRLARDTDEAAAEAAALSERPPPVTALHPLEEDKPTEPHLPAPSAKSGLSLAAPHGVARSSSAPPGPPRPHRTPPPLPPRIEREKERDFASRESTAVSEVLISPSGDLVQGRGIGPDEFSARVAYAARLADLIGRAIRSGTPRALELKGKGTQTTVKWQPDGSLSAALELIQSPKMR